MAQTNIDTLHTAGSVSSLSGDALEVYIDTEIDKVEQLVVTGTTSVITLLSTTGETVLTLDNLYVRASGETYDIFLPASSGSLKSIQIKNLTAGEKSVKPNGTDLIDGLTIKTLSLNASIILIDALTGFWDIN